MSTVIQTLLPPELAKVKRGEAIYQDYYCALDISYVYEDEWDEPHEIPLVFCKANRVIPNDSYAFKVQADLALEWAIQTELENNFHYSGHFNWGVNNERTIELKEPGQKMSQITANIVLPQKFNTKNITLKDMVVAWEDELDSKYHHKPSYKRSLETHILNGVLPRFGLKSQGVVWGKWSPSYSLISFVPLKIKGLQYILLEDSADSHPTDDATGWKKELGRALPREAVAQLPFALTNPRRVLDPHPAAKSPFGVWIGSGPDADNFYMLFEKP